MAELEGRVAVVSGAARGQGLAIVRRLAAAGARVIGGDVLTDELAALGDELGPGAVVGHLDVREPVSWAALLDAGVSEFGRLDILVNNAGRLRRMALALATVA